VPKAPEARAMRTAMAEPSNQSQLVRLARSAFRDSGVHGNESRTSWIEGVWILVRDLDECESRDWSGRASRRSRGGGTLSTTSWSGRGSSSGFPTVTRRRTRRTGRHPGRSPQTPNHVKPVAHFPRRVQCGARSCSSR
jgi:hypothetical protein